MRVPEWRSPPRLTRTYCCADDEPGAVVGLTVGPARYWHGSSHEWVYYVAPGASVVWHVNGARGYRAALLSGTAGAYLVGSLLWRLELTPAVGRLNGGLWFAVWWMMGITL